MVHIFCSVCSLIHFYCLEVSSINILQNCGFLWVWDDFKGTVPKKIVILYLFIHPHGVLNLYDVLSSLEHEIR